MLAYIGRSSKRSSIISRSLRDKASFSSSSKVAPVGVRGFRSKFGQWLLWLCVRDARPSMRFLLDSLVSPTAYLMIDELVRPPAGRGQMTLDERTRSLSEILFPVLHPGVAKVSSFGLCVGFVLAHTNRPDCANV